MSLQINTISANFEVEQAKGLLRQLAQRGEIKNFSETLLVPHTLRSEVQMTAAATSFHVPILVNDNITGNAFNTENRLSLQDVFVVTAIGVFVAKPASSTDTNYDIFNYADPTVFTTANVASSIKGFYKNAFLRYANNNRTVLPYWDLNRHYNAPITQTQTAPGYAANTQPVVASQNGSVDGFYPVQPGIVYNGGGNIDCNVILKGNLTAVESTQRLIVVHRGILLQNASGIS